MSESTEFKVKDVMKDAGRSPFRKYRDLFYGNTSLGHVIACELIVTFTAGIPGAFGLFLRKKLYPLMFRKTGRGVIFGRNMTVRHGHKIELGDGVILDDNSVLDAKGESNQGIAVGDGVYIGRHTIVYCKNGDIRIGRAVNISSNCQIFSSNRLSIGSQTVIGAFTYLLSGGEYDYAKGEPPFAEQSGTNTKGPLDIGPNCWISAGVTVLDAASIGEHCVIGAGAVVTKPVPPHSIAVGVPARVVKSLE
jgi:acetyltransferase-like isoleucine patch superfamily enzyme